MKNFVIMLTGFKKECFDGIELSKGNDLKWLFHARECNYVFYITQFDHELRLTILIHLKT